ncbi:MAG: hypothetical protein MZV70_35535 [Desulfobacterales bacterium]|nr:hypothetical protein [Desulfobacterales bacterium]
MPDRDQLPPAGRGDHRHDELQHRRRPLPRLGPHAGGAAAGAARRRRSTSSASSAARTSRTRSATTSWSARLGRTGWSNTPKTRRIYWEVMGRYRYLFRCRGGSARSAAFAAAARRGRMTAMARNIVILSPAFPAALPPLLAAA